LLSLALLFAAEPWQSQFRACSRPGNYALRRFRKFGKPQEGLGFLGLDRIFRQKILFDTGNNSKIFAANAKALDVDLKNLDFVVISHRHGDHTSGLSHLLKVNPKVKIIRPSGVVRRLWKHASLGVLQDCG
jgi:7,8-dihydropterin-6-yl-methyl-4-(beta-D-ribofuranosyl)aminobenzene 5'-phosphate synthase